MQRPLSDSRSNSTKLNDSTISSSSPQHLAEMPQFVVHLRRTRHRLRDLLTEKLMITMAHALDRFFERFLRHGGIARRFGAGLSCGALDQEWLQAPKDLALAGDREFLGKAGQHLVEQAHRPLALEDFLRTTFVH